MQFVITCPVDGPVEVSLEDIDTVVLREPEEAEIIFSCPECGTEISVTVRIPAFLMSAIEAMATDGDSYVAPLASLVAMAAETDSLTVEGIEFIDPVPASRDSAEQDARIDAYCEYFRRQLEDVEDVEQILRELDCGDR